MSLLDGDVVKVTVKQSGFEEDILNVFFYVYSLIDAGVVLLDLLQEFRDEVWTPILGIMSPSFDTLEMVAENVTNEIDIESLDTPLIGTDTTGGNIMPSYTAAGFRLNVGDKTTRPGSKRFAGIGEGRVSANAYEPDGTTGDDVETALAATVPVVGPVIGEGVLSPVVVGRNIDGSLNLARISPVISAIVSETIRSQVSRRASS